jgi:hypothetical protein
MVVVVTAGLPVLATSVAALGRQPGPARGFHQVVASGRHRRVEPTGRRDCPGADNRLLVLVSLICLRPLTIRLRLKFPLTPQLMSSAPATAGEDTAASTATTHDAELLFAAGSSSCSSYRSCGPPRVSSGIISRAEV